MKKQSTIISILFTFLFIFSFAATAKAEWSTDITNNTPVCTLSGEQWLQDTKSDGNGGVWMTWIDYENRKIALQHYNSNGNATFGTTGHYITSTGYWTSVRILDCSTNFADITWIGSETVDYNESKLNARRIDINGSFLWGIGTNSVILSQFVNEYSLTHTKISDGYVIFALNKNWEDSYYHLYAQKVLFDGSIMWSTTGVYVSGEMGSDSSSYPLDRGFQAVTLSDTNAVVTWISGYEMAAAQALSKDGEILWDSNLSLATSDAYWDSKLKVDIVESDKVIATWWDHKNWNTTKTNLIYAQLFDIFGNREYGETGLLIAETYADYTYANVKQCLFDDGKKLFYEWVYSNKIYRQTLDIDSEVLGYSTIGLIVGELNEPRILDCSYNSYDDTIRHFWSESSNVYCQFLDDNLIPLNGLHELPVALQAKNVYSISSVILDNNNILAVWNDEKNGPSDIFAQYVEAIPEPFLFFPLLLIGFFYKKRKRFLRTLFVL